LIGVNDQYQRLDTAGYRQRFGQLLFRAIELAGNRKGRVFVLSIPDYSFTPFVSEPQKERVRTEIDAFNRINKEITLGQGVQYVEITSSTREAINDPGLLASDKLHYSGKEHLRWAALLVPVIKDALKE
jgi:lysophospholipase L1-like esterase